jgi:hypothetical protein
MTTGMTLIVLCVALGLIVSAGILIPRRRRAKGGLNHSTEPTGQVESELLRRPLRSRYSA